MLFYGENRDKFGELYLFLFCFGVDRAKGETMRESKFQRDLIQDLKTMFPGCVVMKNDSSYIQGIPDLLVLHNDKWCALECKKSANANKQPNQQYYVEKMNDMSYASFIYPENKEEVLRELQSTFEPCGTTRVSRRK